MTDLSVIQVATFILPEFYSRLYVLQKQIPVSGVETILHYMVFNCPGETQLKSSQNYFGVDPRRFTYHSIYLVETHVYEFVYHKVSKDSMRMWMNKIEDVRYVIQDKLRNGTTLEETKYNDSLGENKNIYIFLGIPFE